MNKGPTPYQLFAEHMDKNYPGIPYSFDLDGLKVNHKVVVDFGFGEPAVFNGLLIKYKLPGTRLKKRNSDWATERIATEAAILDEYAEEGWIAQFAVGPEALAQLVDSYLEGAS